ncbi:hypothetical protein E2C01_041229 [Portunus trituberculatus]|uniref:Uncharacterized protein n=1 Tax=Portunus trituberculatus TaxID=210409 RepID=A0A5B7FJG9_PORTR|nr:hypothetical protein [Portunus trituberculatus]
MPDRLNVHYVTLAERPPAKNDNNSSMPILYILVSLFLHLLHLLSPFLAAGGVQTLRFQECHDGDHQQGKEQVGRKL